MSHKGDLSCSYLERFSGILGKWYLIREAHEQLPRQAVQLPPSALAGRPIGQLPGQVVRASPLWSCSQIPLGSLIKQLPRHVGWASSRQVAWIALFTHVAKSGVSSVSIIRQLPRQVTHACVIIPLQIELTPRIWYSYIMDKENKTKKDIKLNLIFTAYGH